MSSPFQIQRGASVENEQAQRGEGRLPASAGAGPQQRRPLVQPGHSQYRDEGSLGSSEKL